MSKWQPIKTAPRDSTKKILLFVGNGYGFDHVKVGLRYENGDVVSVFDDGEALGHLPEEYATHWMPLPEAPEPFRAINASSTSKGTEP